MKILKNISKDFKKTKHNNLNKNLNAVNNIKYIYMALFSLIIIYITHFIVFSSNNLIINRYNPRLSVLEQSIIRGKILDRDGNILAETAEHNGEEHRVYPYENKFAHILGYSHQGKTGIEALADIDLLKSNISLYDQVVFQLTNKKKLGNNVVTTLDKNLQLKANELLGKNRGAIIALEPSTGKILAMVSKPDFNPNEIILNWDTLINDEKNSPLLNRGTQGVYPPGSTFKIITAIEYLNQYNYNDFSYDCKGKADFNGKVIHCYNNTSHGEEDLEKAFSLSCNTAFAAMGEKIDKNELHILAEKLLFNKPLPYSLPYSLSSFKLTNEDNSAQVAETVIGQGETLITPLHNALITSSVANGGILMKPYLIDHVENYKGKVIQKNLPSAYGSLLDTDITREITKYMSEVVNNGTGKLGASDKFQIAAKTGSAENPFGDTHAWYVGFAPAKNPEIVIAILIENAGSSSRSSVPMAKELFELYLSEQDNP